MSNIFDLFGDVGTSTPGHQFKRDTSESMINPMKSRSIASNRNMGLKNAMTTLGTKPKGLSLRPQSDPNICNTNSKQVAEKRAPLKLTSKIISSNSNTISNTPRNNKEKVAKLQTVREKQRKGLSPVSKSPHLKVFAQKQSEEFKFKRPSTPRQFQYRQPEKLSNYCDEEKFDCISVDKLSLDKGFNDLIISRKCITPLEDEDFVSDPEPINVPSLSPVNFLNVHCDDCDDIIMKSPEIPIISDEDDDF